MNPKTEWSIAPVLVSALAPYNNEQLVNAVRAHLGTAKGKLEKEATRSDVKHTSKGVEFTYNESGEKIKFTGNANAVSRFADEADSLKTHFKKHGAPTMPLTSDVFSVEVKAWLDKTFPKVKPAKTPAGNGNGRKGNLKPNVPALKPATA